MSYRITKNCNQCECCAQMCPIGAIEGDNSGNFIILKNDCDGCGECEKACPKKAIIWEEDCDYGRRVYS